MDTYNSGIESSNDEEIEEFEGYEDTGFSKDELKILARQVPQGEGLSHAPDFTPVVTPVKVRTSRGTATQSANQGRRQSAVARRLAFGYLFTFAYCSLAQPVESKSLKRLKNYIRKHAFISQQSTADFTTSQRRKFERDVYDFGRWLGLNRAQIEREQRKNKAFLSHETGYETDDTSYSQELDDSQQVADSLLEKQQKRRRLPTFLSVVDVGGKTAVLSSPPTSPFETTGKPVLEVGSNLRVKYTLSVTFLPVPKYGKAVHTLSATEDQSNAKVTGEANVSQLLPRIEDWISTDFQDIVARNTQAIDQPHRKAKTKHTKVSVDKPATADTKHGNTIDADAGPSATKSKSSKQPKVQNLPEEQNTDVPTDDIRKSQKDSQDLDPPRDERHSVVQGKDQTDFEAFHHVLDDLPTPDRSDASSESEVDNADDFARSTNNRSNAQVIGTKQTSQAQRSDITPPFPINSAKQGSRSRKASKNGSGGKVGNEAKSEEEKQAILAEAHKTLDNMSAHRDNNNRYQLAAYEAGNLGPLSKADRADFEELKADKKIKEKIRKNAEKAEQKAEKKRKKSEEISTDQEAPQDDVRNGDDTTTGGIENAKVAIGEPHSKRFKHKHTLEDVTEEAEKARKKAKKDKKAKKGKSHELEDFPEPRTQ